MQVSVTVKGADHGRWVREENRAIRKSGIQGARKTARQTRTELLRHMRRSLKLGRRPSGSKSGKGLIGTYSVPKRGFNRWPARAGVFSRLVYRRRGGLVDVLDVLDRGAAVSAQGKRWLAVPTEHAPLKSGRGGKRRATPKETGIKFLFIPVNRRLAALKTSRRGPVLYWLVRKIRIRKRLNLDQVFRTSTAKFLPNVETALGKEFDRLQRKFPA